MLLSPCNNTLITFTRARARARTHTHTCDNTRMFWQDIGVYLRDMFKAYFKDNADVKYIDPSYLIRWDTTIWITVGANRLQRWRFRVRVLLFAGARACGKHHCFVCEADPEA